MLDMICSEWIVRVFLLYLLIGGVVAILFRERAAAPLHFALSLLPIIAEKWGCRAANHHFFRARWVSGRIQPFNEPRDVRLRLWSDSGDTGLRYT